MKQKENSAYHLEERLLPYLSATSDILKEILRMSIEYLLGGFKSYGN